MPSPSPSPSKEEEAEDNAATVPVSALSGGGRGQQEDEEDEEENEETQLSALLHGVSSPPRVFVDDGAAADEPFWRRPRVHVCEGKELVICGICDVDRDASPGNGALAVATPSRAATSTAAAAAADDESRCNFVGDYGLTHKRHDTPCSLGGAGDDRARLEAVDDAGDDRARVDAVDDAGDDAGGDGNIDGSTDDGDDDNESQSGTGRSPSGPLPRTTR